MSEAIPAKLYMFEDVMETAVSAWLMENGINDPKKQQDSSTDVDGKKITLKTPRVEVKFLSSGLTREHYYVNQTTRNRWLDMADGVLYLKIVTRRQDSDPSHSILRGTCRYLMQFASSISGKMVNHVIEKIIEASSTITVEADKNHDVSALSFPTTLRILPAAFPTTP